MCTQFSMPPQHWLGRCSARLAKYESTATLHPFPFSNTIIAGFSLCGFAKAFWPNPLLTAASTIIPGNKVGRLIKAMVAEKFNSWAKSRRFCPKRPQVLNSVRLRLTPLITLLTIVKAHPLTRIDG
jgi:hypothetical protein